MDTTYLDQNLETCGVERIIKDSQIQILENSNLKNYEKFMAETRLEDIALNMAVILTDDICEHNLAISVCKYLNPNSEFSYDVSENEITEEETINSISNTIYFNILDIPLNNFSEILKVDPQIVVSQLNLLSTAFPLSYKDILIQYPDILLKTRKELEEKTVKINKLANISSYKANNLLCLLSLNSKTFDTLISTMPTFPYIREKDLEGIFNSPLGLDTEVFLNEMELKFITAPTGKYILEKEDEVMLFIALNEKVVNFTNEKEREFNEERILKVLVRCNDGLVHSRMKQYKMTGEEHFSDGQLGLMIAISKYDYKRGGKFSTYATFWIDQTLRRQLYQGDYGDIATANNLGAMLIKYNRIALKLSIPLKREPTIDEVLDYCKKNKIAMVTKFSLEPILRIQYTVSLDEDQSEDGEDDGSSNLHNILTTDPVIRKNTDVRLAKIEAVEKLLKPRDIEFLRRVADGENMLDIAEAYGISHQAVDAVFKRLRKMIKGYPIK